MTTVAKIDKDAFKVRDDEIAKKAFYDEHAAEYLKDRDRTMKALSDYQNVSHYFKDIEIKKKTDEQKKEC